jgi:glucokinase
MSTPRQVVVGVDLGGTATRVAVVAPDRPEASLKRTVPTRSLVGKSSGQSVTNLAETLRSIIGVDELLAVGVGASGPVDPVRGVIENSDTLPWFSGIGIVEELRSAFGVPVWLENDAVCAAIGEYALGAGAGSVRMLMVTLGTGIGASVIENGQPYRAADGGHPEAGHIGIGVSTDVCYCGSTGCWEMSASRTALERAAVSFFPPLTPAADRMSWLGENAETSPEVQQCLARYGADVGRGLLVLRTVYRPDRIVLGGSVAALYPLFRDSSERVMRLTRAFDVDVPVVVGSLGDIAGAEGAARMATAALTGTSRRPTLSRLDGAPAR